MDANGLNFWMLSRQEDWPLPAATAAQASPSSSLGESVVVADTHIVLLTPFSAPIPAFVLIDSEVMVVSSADATGLELTVTRGAQGTPAVNHPPGAMVWAAVATLQSSEGTDDTQLTITPLHPASIAPGAFLQIASEVLAVSQVDGAGTLIMVTRGALGSTPASYSAGAPVFAPIASNTLYYCTKSNRLQLLSMRLGDPPQESFADALRLVETTPMARDKFGNYARWDRVSSQVVASGSGPGEVPIYNPPAGEKVTDMVMGYDGILYIAAAGTLVMVDRQDRWPNFTLAVSGFKFWRLAALADGGVLALDRSTPQLGTVTGTPLQTGPEETPAPNLLRSCQQNANPPRLSAQYALPSAETFVGFTAVGQQFALLSWKASSPSNTSSFVRLLGLEAGLGPAFTLKGILWPYSVSWLGDLKLAVLATGLNEALVFDLSETGDALVPAGTTYVLSGKNAGPFAHSPELPPYYTAGNKL